MYFSYDELNHYNKNDIQDEKFGEVANVLKTGSALTNLYNSNFPYNLTEYSMRPTIYTHSNPVTANL
jgi:hypothetical protein